VGLIFRAILTGFGLKLGSELGKFVLEKITGKPKGDNPEVEAASEDLPEGLPKDPANPGAEKDEEKDGKARRVAAT
jgi:hypothetical protein